MGGEIPGGHPTDSDGTHLSTQMDEINPIQAAVHLTSRFATSLDRQYPGILREIEFEGRMTELFELTAEVRNLATRPDEPVKAFDPDVPKDLLSIFRTMAQWEAPDPHSSNAELAAADTLLTVHIARRLADEHGVPFDEDHDTQLITAAHRLQTGIQNWVDDVATAAATTGAKADDVSSMLLVTMSKTAGVDNPQIEASVKEPDFPQPVAEPEIGISEEPEPDAMEQPSAPEAEEPVAETVIFEQEEDETEEEPVAPIVKDTDWSPFKNIDAVKEDETTHIEATIPDKSITFTTEGVREGKIEFTLTPELRRKLTAFVITGYDSQERGYFPAIIFEGVATRFPDLFDDKEDVKEFLGACHHLFAPSIKAPSEGITARTDLEELLQALTDDEDDTPYELELKRTTETLDQEYNSTRQPRDLDSFRELNVSIQMRGSQKVVEPTVEPKEQSPTPMTEIIPAVETAEEKTTLSATYPDKRLTIKVVSPDDEVGIDCRMSPLLRRRILEAVLMAQENRDQGFAQQIDRNALASASDNFASGQFVTNAFVSINDRLVSSFNWNTGYFFYGDLDELVKALTEHESEEPYTIAAPTVEDAAEQIETENLPLRPKNDYENYEFDVRPRESKVPAKEPELAATPAPESDAEEDDADEEEAAANRIAEERAQRLAAERDRRAKLREQADAERRAAEEAKTEPPVKRQETARMSYQGMRKEVEKENVPFEEATTWGETGAMVTDPNAMRIDTLRKLLPQMLRAKMMTLLVMAGSGSSGKLIYRGLLPDCAERSVSQSMRLGAMERVGFGPAALRELISNEHPYMKNLGKSFTWRDALAAREAYFAEQDMDEPDALLSQLKVGFSGIAKGGKLRPDEEKAAAEQTIDEVISTI